ncbi:MAG: tyrosine-type recombinase/integrase [Pseudomonadota bacterium]|nr:tyrosine-type recombinase/integrase [Pseudomonadota bacterium]
MSMHLSPIIPAPPHDTSALSAQNDQQAILIWLDARATRSIHTQVSYRKEAVRFVLFITQELGLAGLAQVKVEHIQQYLQHLAQPPAHWLIDTTIPAQQRPATQRLKKPLSASSIAYARLVINSLYRYLQDAGHLKHNPVSLSSQPINNVTDMAEKALEPAAWLFLWQWLIDQEQQARTISQYRLAVRNRWLCTLLYHTGLRRSSIAAGRMSGLARREGKWSLYVPIKGGRQHMVVMHPHLLEELKRYRLAFGLSALPAPNEDQPLISNIRQLGQPVLARNIGADFEKFTQAAAATCDDPYLAEQIRHLTAHGLRHTHATHSLMAGARLEAVQNSLAHRSIATTSIYARASLAMREQHADQLAQFWQQLQP